MHTVGQGKIHRQEPNYKVLHSPPIGPPALLSFSLPSWWRLFPHTGTVLCYLQRGPLLLEQPVALPPDLLLISETSL